MEARTMYEVIVNSLSTHVAVLDSEGVIIETNQAWQDFARQNGMIGNVDCVGINYLGICESNDENKEVSDIAKAIRAVISGKISNYTTEYPCHSPTEKRWFSLKILPYKSARDKRVIITHEDITPLILYQRELKNKEELLSQEAEKLQEANIAMKVLLEHRNRDKQELEDRFLANIRELVFPYLEKLENSRLAQREQALANIIREHLEDITTPFLGRISALHQLLTPQELEVALLVRQGKSSQEISDVMNISVATVSFHRKKLRKKLGLSDRSRNLRTYLLSLS